MIISLVLFLEACVLWDDGPFARNVANSTDADQDGFSLAADDCNDADPDVHPGAAETCDGVDNDCNGAIDEVFPDTVWCQDVDADGFGDVAHQTRTCFPEAGWVTDCGDCDDADRLVHPDATETCDGVDNDCDGTTDPEGAAGSQPWYPDVDGDGYGGAEPVATACTPPPDTVADHSDCDDADEESHPGAPEECDDGRDNDCDGTPNACVWSGTTLLDTSRQAFVAGPEVRQEYAGLTLGLADVNGDATDDIVFSSTGAMYGDDSFGALHVWYGAPVGARTIDEAAAHLVGAEDLYFANNIGQSPVVVLPDEDGEPSRVIVASQGSSSAFDERGVLLSVAIGPYGKDDIAVDAIFARGVSDAEGFGSTVTLAEGLVEDGVALVVGAPFNSERGSLGGAVYVTRPAEPDGDAAAASFLGDVSQVIGGNIQCAADLTGDGVTDLVLGTGYIATPAVYLFEGPVSGAHLMSDADAEAGSDTWVADRAHVVDDVDEDGIADLALPAGHRLDLLSGAALGGGEPLGWLQVDSEGDPGVGYGLAVGDFYADDVVDLAVGVPFVSAPAELGGVVSGGAVAIVALDQTYAGGVDLWTAASAVFYGPDARAEIGFPLAVGDVNHDGAVDLLVGAAAWSANGYPSAGGLWFLLGSGI